MASTLYENKVVLVPLQLPAALLAGKLSATVESVTTPPPATVEVLLNCAERIQPECPLARHPWKRSSERLVGFKYRPSASLAPATRASNSSCRPTFSSETSIRLGLETSF